MSPLPRFISYLLAGLLLTAALSVPSLFGQQYAPAPPPGFALAPPAQNDALTLVPLGLTELSREASWHTDFTFDRSLLSLAGAFTGVDDQTRQTIARLNGISVHLFRFPQGAGYDPTVLDAVRAQYGSLGWKHVVTANKFPDARGNGQPSDGTAPGAFIPSGPGRTDVWLQSRGVNFAGAAVLLAGPTNVNLIVVSGDISTLDLLHLRGHFGIPRFPDDALNR